MKDTDAQAMGEAFDKALDTCLQNCFQVMADKLAPNLLDKDQAEPAFRTCCQDCLDAREIARKVENG